MLQAELEVVLLAVMTDLAALRRTVLDDPSFADLYEKKTFVRPAKRRGRWWPRRLRITTQ